MRDDMRTRLKFGAVLAAATVALALGGCASEGNLDGDLTEGSSSDGQPDTTEPSGEETAGSDSEESILEDSRQWLSPRLGV